MALTRGTLFALGGGGIAIGLACGGGPRSLLDLEVGDTFAEGEVEEAGSDRAVVFWPASRAPSQLASSHRRDVAAELQGRGLARRACIVHAEERQCDRWNRPDGPPIETWMVYTDTFAPIRMTAALAPAPPLPELPAEAPWAGLEEVGADGLFVEVLTCRMALGPNRPSGTMRFGADGRVRGEAEDAGGNPHRFEGTWRGAGSALRVEGRWEPYIYVRTPLGCISGIRGKNACDVQHVTDERQDLAVYRAWRRPGFAFFETDHTFLPKERDLVACGEGVVSLHVAVLDGGGGEALKLSMARAAATWGVEAPGARLVLDGGAARNPRTGVEVLHDGREGSGLALLTHLELYHPELAFTLREWPGEGAPAPLVVVVGSG